MTKITALLQCAALAAAAILPWQTAAAAAPFALGAYLSNPNGNDAGAEATFEANYASFAKAMGAAPTLIDVYVDYTQLVSNWPANASWQAWSNSQSAVARNMVPVIGFPMASIAWGHDTPDAQFQAFASGQYDSAIQGVVQAWTNAGFKTLIVRVGWEMNISGVSYAGDYAQQQADWVAAFRHIYTVLHQAAAAAGASMQVVWNPGATNYSNIVATRQLYPGDASVDVIGADIYGGMYPFSDGPGTQLHDWKTGGEDSSVAAFISESANRWHYFSYPAATKWSLDGSGGHSQSLFSLIDFARRHNKPFAVPECGAGNSSPGNDVTDDPTFPHWLGNIMAAAQKAGSVIAFVNVWNTDDEGLYQFSYVSNGKPAEAAAWRAYVGARSVGYTAGAAAPLK